MQAEGFAIALASLVAILREAEDLLLHLPLPLPFYVAVALLVVILREAEDLLFN